MFTTLKNLKKQIFSLIMKFKFHVENSENKVSKGNNNHLEY